MSEEEKKIKEMEELGIRLIDSPSETVAKASPTKLKLQALTFMVIGKIEYEALLPGVIASFTASYTSHFLGLEKFSVNIQQSINMNDLKI